MANIIHIRIDDRLIHGQVANRWSVGLNVERIIVPNDEVAVNDVQKSALRMSAPKGINTSLINVDTTIKNLLDNKYGDQRLMIIVNNPMDIERLIKGGIEIKEFNVGNLSKRDNAKQIKNSVSLTEDELASINRMLDMGIDITAQMLPDEKKLNIKEYL